MVILLSGVISSGAVAVTYDVQEGDTLWSISQTKGATVEELKSWNQLSNDLIFPNETLNVEKTADPKQDIEYIVQKGDSLWGISNEYGVEISQLKSWNQLSSNLIHPGQKLIVKPEKDVVTEQVQKQSQVKDKTEAVTSTTSNEKQVDKKTETEKPKAEQAPQQEEASQTSAQPVKEQAQSDTPQGTEMTVTATAYTAYCNGCSGVTATGQDLRANPNQKVIAVDPSVIPLGSKVHVEGYGTAVAGDTGGAIKGNKIDIFMPSKEDAINFGRKSVKITVLN